MRQRGPNIVPIVGARKVSQIEDVLGCLDFSLAQPHLDRLDEVSKIELGFPRGFLGNANVRSILYGDQADRVDLPKLAQPPR